MKITNNIIDFPLDSDLLVHKPSSTNRKSTVVRLKRDRAPAGKRSRPETPLLRWKLGDYTEKADVPAKDDSSVPEFGRKTRKGREVSVSARKLAAGLWRLQLPEVPHRSENDRLGFQSTSGHIGAAYLTHHHNNLYDSQTTDPLKSPHPVTGPRNGLSCKLDPSLHVSNSAMEGVTKWDPACCQTLNEVHRMYGHSKCLDQQGGVVSRVSTLELELEQARTRIHELETERRSSKKKLKHFLKKLSEERAIWRNREHEKIRAVIDDVKADLNRERKNRQRMEIVNSKLVNELADVKLSAKRFMQDFEKERKARKLIEEVCDELAKEIGEDKAEVEALKSESMKMRDEVADERKMLQMAEVWREERVQMKLVDAKVTLEEKYSQMNKLIADLEKILNSKNAITNEEEMRKTELLRQVAASVNIKDIREFIYEPSNAEDIFSIFEDVNSTEEPNERENEPCRVYSPASRASKVHTVSPEANAYNKEGIQGYTNGYIGQNGDIEDDDSGWETVSHLDEQGSSYSPNGSVPRVNKIRRDSNMLGSGTEWDENAGEETPMTEISEVCSVPTGQLKKVSSISRLWRSVPRNGGNYKIIAVDGMNGRLYNGRLSSGAITSPDRGSGKGGLSPVDLTAQWSSPDSGNPHITRATKGCIEWPRVSQKNSLKTKLLEARMETQKIQLHQVLKQKI